MTIHYVLSEDDYLTYHLFTSSQSTLARKKRRNSRLLLSIGYSAIGGYFLFNGNENGGYTFILMGILWFIVQPYYVKFRFKRHVRAQLKESLKGIVNREISLKIGDTELITKDGENEAQFPIENATRYVQLPEHYLIEITDAGSLIIPIRELESPKQFENLLSARGLQHVDCREWKW